MPRPTAALDQIALLLPWLNRDQLTLSATRDRLEAFLALFDKATPTHGYVRALGGAGRVELRRSGAYELEQLRERLRTVLRRSFPDERHHPSKLRDEQLYLQPSRLVFGAIRQSRPTPGKASSRAGQWERQRHFAAGAFVQLVDGRLGDLLVYFVLRLLTEPGMATLAQCPAPADDDEKRPCGRFLLATGRGRPKMYCTAACRVRNQTKLLRDLRREQKLRGRTR